MGKVGVLADATMTPALKTGAQKVANLASRIEIKPQPGVASCNGLGGVNISLKPQVEVPTTAPAPTAPKVAEATVSEAPLGLTTAAERVQNNPMLMKHYKYHMEKITELKLHPAQTEKLKEVLRTTNFEKLGKEERIAHRAMFDKIKARLRQEWEANTGQKWPVYEKDYYNKAGTKVIKNAGEPYDAHHIIHSNPAY
jgi:hypothetical protein